MRYKGGVISATPPTTSTSAATGVWTLVQQMQAQAAGAWPVAPSYWIGLLDGLATLQGYSVAVDSSGNTTGDNVTYTSSTTTSVIDGPGNSATLAAQGRYAATFCEGLTIGGYSDWYLPSLNELQTIFYYSKPTTANNSASYGSNANAVSPQPVNTNYSLTIPAQSSAAVFKNGGGQQFGSSNYWTSTTKTPSPAQGIYQVQFQADGTGGNCGTIGGQYQPSTQGIRAIRRVAA